MYGDLRQQTHAFPGIPGADTQPSRAMQKNPIEPDSHYEERRITPRWKRGELPAAGIYLLDDAYHVAIPGTPAEQRLLESGALVVAGIRFDAQPMDARPKGEIRILSALPGKLPLVGKTRAVERLGWTPTRN